MATICSYSGAVADFFFTFSQASENLENSTGLLTFTSVTFDPMSTSMLSESSSIGEYLDPIPFFRENFTDFVGDLKDDVGSCFGSMERLLTLFTVLEMILERYIALSAFPIKSN